MPLRASALLLLFPMLCEAADSAQPVVRIEVSAQRQDAAVGRQVVGRAELAAYGDSNLADALKRQSGIAVVGGEVRMRGLGAGYTRILIDGEPAPPGFSIDSIAPDMVERIEIARTATAEQTTGAVAGSINIILRRRARNTPAEVSGTFGAQHGYLSPSVSTAFGARQGLLAWSVNATIERNEVIDVIRTDTTIEASDGAPLAVRRAMLHGRATVERLNLAPRLQWTFDGGDTLVWQSLATSTRLGSRNRTEETTLLGAGTPYPSNDARLDARTDHLRSDLSWAGRVDGGKLTVTALADTQRRTSGYLFRGRRAGTGTDADADFTRRVDAGTAERLFAVKGKYLRPLGAAHSLAVGWDAGRTHRDEYRHQFDADGDGAGPRATLQDYTGVVERLALFAQDEWEVDEQLQAYLGLRWEALRTATSGADILTVRTDQSVVSPVAHLSWKLPARQQLRLGLARTYKAPLPRDLVPRRFTINNDNSAVNPDFEGNPALRPELSWGLDGAYERSIGKDGTASVSGYLRRVSNVTAQLLYRDGASWVTRPVNDGVAQVAGLELDVKTPVQLGALRLDLRMNLARNWSRVERVPGPDNVLAEQVPLTANLGLDHQSAAGWSAGANLGLQRGATSVSSSGVHEYRGTQALLDLNWSRKLESAWLLRVAAVNALGRDRASGTTYRDTAGQQRRVGEGQGFATVRVTLKRTL